MTRPHNGGLRPAFLNAPRQGHPSGASSPSDVQHTDAQQTDAWTDFPRPGPGSFPPHAPILSALSPPISACGSDWQEDGFSSEVDLEAMGYSDIEHISRRTSEDFDRIDEEAWAHDPAEYSHVDATEVPARLPPGAKPAQRMRMDEAMVAVMQAAFEGGARAAKRAVVDGDISTLLNPAHIATKVIQGTVVGLVQGGYGIYQGAPRLNHDEVIKAAREHLEQGVFSPAQRTLVQKWLQDGRERLDAWRNEHRSDELVDLMATTAPSDEEGKTALPKSSVKALSSANERELVAQNPPTKVMLEQARELHDVLQALAAFSRWPSAPTYTTRSEVLENIAAHPALGAKDFIDGLKTCAQGLARNPYKQSIDKRVMLAISGPGTGKTTSILAMTRWAGLPCVMLTGEDFNVMMAQPENAEKKPYEVFTRWVAQAVLLGFEGSINGVLLLDDFHKALEVKSHGVLSESSAPDDRKKFFEFLKLMGDASQDAFVSVPLADKHTLPLNLGDVHIIITLNRRPPELDTQGEEALRSRLADLNAGYMTPDDRMEHGHKLAETLLRQIEDMGGTVSPSVRRQALTSYESIVALDLQYYRALHESLGQRGLCDMLNRFGNHVSARVTAALQSGQDVTAATFTFAPDFDLKGIAGGIKDYEKVIDAAQAKEDKQRQLHRLAEGVRAKLASLPQAHRGAIEALLQRTDAPEGGERYLEAAQKRLADYTRVLPVIDRHALASNLEAQFSYLVGGADEASPFDKLASIAKEIHRRLAGSSRGLYELLEPNRPIHVLWENSLGTDPMLFHELAKAVGGVPVKVIDNPAQLVRSTFLAQYAVEPGDADAVNAIKAKTFLVDGYHCNVKSTTYQQKVVLYLREMDLGHYYFCKNTTLDLLKQTPDGEKLPVRDSDKFLRTRSMDDFETRAQPQLSLFDHLLDETAGPLPEGYGASFMVIKWNRLIAKAVADWSYGQASSGDADPETMFSKYVQRQLNRRSIELADGRSFDPRAISVFIEGSSKPTYLQAREGETAAVWNIPVLPKAGRRRYADRFLQQCLAKMQQRAIDNEKIFGVSQVVDLRANANEQAALQRLADFDEGTYARSKDLRYPLGLEPLQEGIRWIASAIEARSVASQHDSPRDSRAKLGVGIEEKRWDEYYAKDVSVLKAIEAENSEREELERQQVAFSRFTTVKSDQSSNHSDRGSKSGRKKKSASTSEPSAAQKPKATKSQTDPSKKAEPKKAGKQASRATIESGTESGDNDSSGSGSDSSSDI